MRSALGSIRRFYGAVDTLETDMLRAATLLDVYKMDAADMFKLTIGDVTRMEDEHYGQSMEYLKPYVEQNILPQLVSMFEAVDSGKPYRFTVKAGASTIPNAGLGLFMATTDVVVPGTIVALYPGRVFLKHEVESDDGMKMLGSNDNYMLMLRRDGHLVDPRNLDDVPFNPFAFGHYINHCGSSRKPNVFQVPFDYPDDLLGRSNRNFPKHLRKYVPNVYANKPSMMSKMGNMGHFMKGIVMMATRPIRNDEELFLDYRFPVNPALPWPSWYEPAPVAKLF